MLSLFLPQLRLDSQAIKLQYNSGRWIMLQQALCHTIVCRGVLFAGYAAL